MLVEVVSNAIVVIPVLVGPGLCSAALLDLTTFYQSNVFVQVEVGATAPAAATTVSLRRAVGSTAAGMTVLSGAAAGGSTYINVASAAGFRLGSTIAVISASSLVGEVLSVSSIAGSVLGVSTLVYPYVAGDLVFLVEDCPSGGVVAPSASGSWSTFASYGTTLYPPTGVWILHSVNGDSTASVAVSCTVESVSFAASDPV